MRIIVNGAAGRMGTVLRGMIQEGLLNSSLAAAVDTFAPSDEILPSLDAFTGAADCLIDFSNPAGTKELLDYAVSRKLPLVLSTTGHTDEQLAMITAASTSIPIFHSGNMSLGIAVLMQLARNAAKMFPDADIEIVEQHHNQKLDVPSGTALMLGKAVQEARPESKLLVGRHANGKRTKEEIGIHSLRMGNTVGIHEVIINTGTQIISLKHEAQTRALFAEGALSAAAFLIGKAPGLYDMKSIVTE